MSILSLSLSLIQLLFSLSSERIWLMAHAVHNETRSTSGSCRFSFDFLTPLPRVVTWWVAKVVRPWKETEKNSFDCCYSAPSSPKYVYQQCSWLCCCHTKSVCVWVRASEISLITRRQGVQRESRRRREELRVSPRFYIFRRCRRVAVYGTCLNPLGKDRSRRHYV